MKALVPLVVLVAAVQGQASPVDVAGRDGPAAQAPLGDVEIATPFVVSDIKGTIYTTGRQPLLWAEFGISRTTNVIDAVGTGFDGSFRMSGRLAKPPGTYRFKAWKEGFHATVGTLVIRQDAPKENSIDIELQPGPDVDVRTPERRRDDRESTPLPPCANAVNQNPIGKVYRDANINLPVSLAMCSFRTPDFLAVREPYFIMLQAGKALPFDRLTCMMGLTQPRELQRCSSVDPVLRAEWIVREGAQIVREGTSSRTSDGMFTNDYVIKFLGEFMGEAGKRYSVEVRFTSDVSLLNATNPHLIVVLASKH